MWQYMTAKNIKGDLISYNQKLTFSIKHLCRIVWYHDKELHSLTLKISFSRSLATIVNE